MLPLVSLLIQVAFSLTVDSFILKNADNMVRDTEANTVQLSGNVQVVYQQQYLSCDEAIIHLGTKTIEAQGNVVYTTPQVYAEAVKMFFNYENNTGIIYNGYVQSGQVSFEGELIYKVGDNEFEASDSTYTSCTTCPPAWSFSGSEIKATFGGYARIKNSILRIANIPVFWFPYIIVPIKNERQTGILAPSHEISKQGGNAFSLPFFWAINESSDLTYTLKNYEFKGLKSLLEYRYVLGPKSRGQLHYAYIQDEVFPESDRLTKEIGIRDRWFLSYQHLYTMPSYIEHRVDLNLTSDLQYSFDYPEELPFYREPALHNRMSLSRYHPDYHISMDAIHYTNQMQTDPLAENESSVHIMPEIRWSVVNRRIKKTNLFYKMDLDYVNFARGTYSFDDLNNNSIYDESLDVVRTGQRLIVRPEILAPFHIGEYIDVLPSMAYQSSTYKFADVTSDSPRANLLQTQISLRSDFSRIFDADPNDGYVYKHESTPFLTYTKLPYMDKNDHPFWGTSETVPYSSDQSVSDNDILLDSEYKDIIQFDYKDRIAKRDFIEFGFNNTFTRKDISTNNPTYRDVVLWSISQKYDLEEAEKNTSKKEPWSNINNTIKLNFIKWSANASMDYYPYQNHVNSSTRFRYLPSGDNFFEISYNQSFIIKKGEDVDSSTETKDILFSTAYHFNNFNIAGGLEYSAVTEDFEKYQYGIQIMPPGECWFFSISQIVNSQDIKTKFNFEFLFDGKSKNRFHPQRVF